MIFKVSTHFTTYIYDIMVTEDAAFNKNHKEPLDLLQRIGTTH